MNFKKCAGRCRNAGRYSKFLTMGQKARLYSFDDFYVNNTKKKDPFKMEIKKNNQTLSCFGSKDYFG